jgi:hypothetical protein
VTVHDVLLQYESRLLELQTGIAQLSLPYVQAAGVLTLAVGLFLAIIFAPFGGRCPSSGHHFRFQSRLFPRTGYSGIVEQNSACCA